MPISIAIISYREGIYFSADGDTLTLPIIGADGLSRTDCLCTWTGGFNPKYHVRYTTEEHLGVDRMKTFSNLVKIPKGVAVRLIRESYDEFLIQTLQLCKILRPDVVDLDI